MATITSAHRVGSDLVLEVEVTPASEDTPAETQTFTFGHTSADGDFDAYAERCVAEVDALLTAAAPAPTTLAGIVGRNLG